MSELFKKIDESSFASNFKAFQAVKLLNTGIHILNHFLDIQLGKDAAIINEFTPKNDEEDTRTFKQLHDTVKFQQIRVDIEARKSALNYYLDGKLKNKSILKIDNPFVFFRAHELIAIADMLEIVIEKVSNDIQLLPNNEKQAINVKLDELKQQRNNIIECMKMHFELAYHNSQQRVQDSDLNTSFQDIRSNQEVPHTLITLTGLVPDCSLGNAELTKHPMRKEFKSIANDTHTPNQKFLFSYIYEYGTAQDKEWVTAYDNGLIKQANSIFNKFWKSLPTISFSVFSSYTVPTPEAPALQTSQSEPELNNSNLNTSWANMKRSISEPSTIVVKTDKQELKEKLDKAWEKYNEYYPDFTTLNIEMNQYLNQIKKAQGLYAYRSNGFIDFVKNVFCTRKILKHEFIIMDIQKIISSELFVNFDKNSDEKKIEVMEKTHKDFLRMVNFHYQCLKDKEYYFPSELEKILKNILTNEKFPWNKKDGAQQAVVKLGNSELESDWTKIEMTSPKGLSSTKG